MYHTIIGLTFIVTVIARIELSIVFHIENITYTHSPRHTSCLEPTQASS